MNITLLGTGSPEANKDRASSGYLIEAGHDIILLDCGGGVFDRLLQAGYKPSDVTHLFFTHLHSDHMMDYARLVHAAWDEGGGALKVFGPAPIREINDKLFGNNGVFATDLTARTEHVASQQVWRARGGTIPRPWPAPVITEIESGFTYRSAASSETPWSLSSCEVFHAQPHLDSMAFKVTMADKSFVYSGDAALSTEFENFARGCDLLLHWCYRDIDDHSMPAVTELSPDPIQIAQLATRVGCKQLVLTHLRTKMDTPANQSNIIAAVSQNYSGDFQIANDLMKISL